MPCLPWQRWRAEQPRNGSRPGPDAVRFAAHLICRQQAAFPFPVAKRIEVDRPVFLFADAHEPLIRHRQTYRETAMLSSRAKVEGSRKETFKVTQRNSSVRAGLAFSLGMAEIILSIHETTFDRRTLLRLPLIFRDPELFFFQAEDGIRDPLVTGVQTCALPI